MGGCPSSTAVVLRLSCSIHTHMPYRQSVLVPVGLTWYMHAEGWQFICLLVLCRLVQEGVLKPQADIEVPEIPMDLATAVKLKKV